MQPKSRIPSHPGEILLHEFLEPLRRTQVALAEHLGIFRPAHQRDRARQVGDYARDGVASRPGTWNLSRAMAQPASGP